MINAVKNSPQSILGSQAGVAQGKGDVLSALGAQMEMTPEMEEAMKAQGLIDGKSNPEAAFSDVLKGEAGKVAVDAEGKPIVLDEAKKLVDGKEAKLASDTDAKQLAALKNKGKINELAGQDQQKAGSPYSNSLVTKPEAQVAAKKVMTEEEIVKNQKSLFIKPKFKPEEVKQATTEAASRAFVPKRKSMFNVAQEEAPKAAKPQMNGLMDLDTFMAKQNKGSQMRMAQATYKPQQEQSMFAKKLEQDVSRINNMSQDKTMTINDIMLGQADASSSGDFQSSMGQNQMQSEIKGATATAGAAKVFDMNQLTANDNQTAVINKIQDYVVQAKASNQPRIEMSFQDKDLGVIDLVVQRGQGTNVDIAINSRSLEGAKFFTQNQAELLQTLNQSGVQVGDLKLDSSSTNNSSNQNSSQGRGEGQQQGAAGQHANSQKGQQQEDSRRRQELWEQHEQNQRAA